jgi:hypothetical protein
MDIICTDPSCDCRAAVAYRASTPPAPTGPAWCNDDGCSFADGHPHLLRDHVLTCPDCRVEFPPYQYSGHTCYELDDPIV